MTTLGRGASASAEVLLDADGPLEGPLVRRSTTVEAASVPSRRSMRRRAVRGARCGGRARCRAAAGDGHGREGGHQRQATVDGSRSMVPGPRGAHEPSVSQSSASACPRLAGRWTGGRPAGRTPRDRHPRQPVASAGGIGRRRTIASRPDRTLCGARRRRRGGAGQIARVVALTACTGRLVANLHSRWPWASTASVHLAERHPDPSLARAAGPEARSRAHGDRGPVTAAPHCPLRSAGRRVITPPVEDGHVPAPRCPLGPPPRAEHHPARHRPPSIAGTGRP